MGRFGITLYRLFYLKAQVLVKFTLGERRFFIALCLLCFGLNLVTILGMYLMEPNHQNLLVYNLCVGEAGTEAQQSNVSGAIKNIN